MKTNLKFVKKDLLIAQKYKPKKKKQHQEDIIYVVSDKF